MKGGTASHIHQPITMLLKTPGVLKNALDEVIEFYNKGGSAGLC